MTARRSDAALHVMTYMLGDACHSATSASALVARALETGEDRAVVGQLVEEAVAYARARDAASRIHRIALGYRAPGVRPRGPQ